MKRSTDRHFDRVKLIRRRFLRSFVVDIIIIIIIVIKLYNNIAAIFAHAPPSSSSYSSSSYVSSAAVCLAINVKRSIFTIYQEAAGKVERSAAIPYGSTNLQITNLQIGVGLPANGWVGDCLSECR